MDFQVIFRKSAGRVQPVILWDDFNNTSPMGVSFADGVTPNPSVIATVETLASEYISAQSAAQTKETRWAAYRIKERVETQIYKLATTLH